MHAHNLETIVSLPASQHGLAGPEQGVATVTRVAEAGGWWLRLGERELEAKQAASCLLTPSVGDTVWIAGDGEHGAFVLAVLVRAGDGPATLAVPGDLELAAGGEICVRGQGGVQIETPKRLGLRSDSLELQAREGHMVFAELRAVVREVFASLARVTQVGKLLELLVDTVTQRSHNSYRAIAGVDHVEAEIIHHEASADVHINAARTLINGEDIVKMDGGQIHLG